MHPEISGSCGAQNESYFGGYNSSTAPINFNGQTIVMTAKANVIPGTNYHIKLVIADHENIRYDSAIFLGGGSFNVGADLGPNRLIANNNAVCQGTTITLNATEPGINGYQWYKNNIAIPGAVNPTYAVSSAGIYKVEIALGATACIAKGEVTIEYSPIPVLSDTTIVQCDANHDGTSLYNLATVDNIIKNGDTTLGNVVYYETLAGAQNQDTSQIINNPTAYTSIPKNVYGSVKNAYGCAGIATVSLQISNHTALSERIYETCDLDATIDGFYGVNFNDVDLVVLAGLPAGLVVQYYPSVTDALLQTNILSSPFTNTVQYQTLIYAKVLNGPDCYGIIPVHLYINSLVPANFEDQMAVLCENGSVRLQVATNFINYNWSNGNTEYYADVTEVGDYTVTVSDTNGCEATKKFTVVLSQAPQITNIIIDDFNEHGDSVMIEYTGVGNYEFSINGSYFQSSPFFGDVAPGDYTVFVRDKGGCGLDTQNIRVLDYPKYFTPNGDGYNDTWAIKNLPILPGTSINIFDRLGKLVYQINSNEKSWNGKLNSKNLPSEDYWFVIHLENKTIKGHFALKR